MPRKMRNAIRHRVFTAQMRATKVAPYASLDRLGSDYGGWWVPAGLIRPDWLCYSVGAGHDVSFDLGLLALGARVRAFDPFHVFREMAEREAGGDTRYSFHEVAIATADGPLSMFGRQDTEAGSVSAVNLYGVETAHQRPGRTLRSLMSEFDDEQVQLLKLDIEGSEYDVVPTLDLTAMGVRVLCVEFHDNQPARSAKSILSRLRAQGYEVVRQDGGTDFTLIDELLLKPDALEERSSGRGASPEATARTNAPAR